MTGLLFQSLFETVLMVSISMAIGIIIGTPLAVLLIVTTPEGLYPCRFVNQLIGFLVNATRSIPYIILTVLLMPVTKVLVGSTIGTLAAIVPLGIAALLLVTRVVEEALRNVPIGLVEVGLGIGATNTQIINKIMLPEALPSIISGLTTVSINLVGFSAMAGAVGGGGLGDLAIRYGYQRYDVGLVFLIVLILIIMVQSIQMIGDVLVRKLTK